jgi:hypothetical protein
VYAVDMIVHFKFRDFLSWSEAARAVASYSAIGGIVGIGKVGRLITDIRTVWWAVKETVSKLGHTISTKVCQQGKVRSDLRR